jgi:hypothetical protein
VVPRRSAGQAVIVPYIVSRVIVLASLAMTRHIFTTLDLAKPLQTRQGLFAWDAAFYRDIASGGYDAVDRSGLRFFPLVPLLARGISVLPGIDAGLGLLIVANLSALIAGIAVWRLIWREREDSDLARRAVWIAFLAPSAFVLVMGYAEATLMACGAVALLGLRSRRWWIAALAAYLAGVARPVGLLLVIPALIEVLRDRWRVPRREVVGRVAAVVAAPLGTLTYLLWARSRSDGFLYPLRVHEEAGRRGEFVDPVTGFAHAVREAFSGDHVSAAVHVVSALILIALLVVLARRWPASYTAYAAATLVLGLSSRNLDSLERYSLATVPFVIAAADVVWDDARERVVVVLLGAALVAASVLAFTGVMVP